MTRDAAEALQGLGAHAQPIDGGFSGETFLVGAAGEQAVLRLYVRQPCRAAVDAALLELVHGLVPVPRVLDLRTPQMTEGHAYLLTELLPGERLEVVLPTADRTMRERLAVNLADVLARLSGIPFRRGGEFADATLAVRDHPHVPDSLVDWVRRHLLDTALARWPADQQERLLAMADHADGVLAANDRWCLAHSDFNAKNVLVDPTTGEVTGLVDWEFAHAGTPYTDLGNLLRLQRDAGLVQPLLDRLRDRAPALAADVLDSARAADLWALVELGSRAGQHAPADRAHDLLRAIATQQDLHAQPTET
ncbi:MAG TPA: phosphotransferase [Nocardioidaceae bacterium]|nr:phosphotransferase [Nocardioidaceae bacterium]